MRLFYLLERHAWHVNGPSQLPHCSRNCNLYSEAQLQHPLQNYGKVHNAPMLAQAIVTARAVKPIHMTEDLWILLLQWVHRGKEFNYYAQVFQALHIKVNDDLGAPQEILQQSVHLCSLGSG